ncbi:hypothetical protein LCGC14_0972520 [marine sediment metagenome]|uniref:Uncharacterized protein n=1 Tax=marine sediment metagenome TaxID=412755 RepID=A0A0F9NBC5_9ZZZZ
MNAKKVKKLRQYYKRDLKKQLLAEYSLISSAIKTKPRFMPRVIFRLLALLYVKKNYRDKLFGK